MRLKTVLAWMVGIAVFAFAGATIWTQLMWGYWFTRPQLDPRVCEPAAIISVSDIAVSFAPDGICSARVFDFDPQEITQHFSDRGVMQAMKSYALHVPPPRMREEDAAVLAFAIKKCGIDRSVRDRGYYTGLYGEAIEFTGKSGDAFTFVAIATSHSDRRMRYVELLLSRSGGAPLVISRTCFSFGGRLERWQWPQAFGGLVCGALGFVLARALAMQAAQWWRGRSRVARGFPVVVRERSTDKSLTSESQCTTGCAGRKKGDLT